MGSDERPKLQLLRTVRPVFDGSVTLCAADASGVTGTCFGDSGGPPLTFDANGRPVQIGITGHGPADCSTTSADSFTAADPMSSWLSDSINSVALSSPPQPVGIAKLPLPTLTSSDARGMVRQTLAGVLGARVKRGHGYQARCNRGSAIRFRCDTALW
jgi:hypothetical protein